MRAKARVMGGGAAGRLGLLALALLAAAGLAQFFWARLPAPAPPAAGRAAPAAGVVVIDPGHGGRNHGAVSAGGLREDDLSLTYARDLARHLGRAHGVRVLATRQKNRRLPLAARAALANRNRARAFVSLHFNADLGPLPSRAGFMAIHSPRGPMAGVSAALAHCLGRALRAAGRPAVLSYYRLLPGFPWWGRFLGPRVAYLPENYRLGVYSAQGSRLTVLEEAKVPAVLLEIGFLSNRTEARELARAETREEICRALAAGLARFLAGGQAGGRENLAGRAGPGYFALAQP